VKPKPVFGTIKPIHGLRRPYNLYCVGGDVKPCTITIPIHGHSSAAEPLPRLLVYLFLRADKDGKIRKKSAYIKFLYTV